MGKLIKGEKIIKIGSYLIRGFDLGNNSMHRGAFCQFTFQWIHYYENNKSTGLENAPLCNGGNNSRKGIVEVNTVCMKYKKCSFKKELPPFAPSDTF